MLFLLPVYRFHFTMLAWLPTYFTETLKLADLSHAAHTSLVPPLAGIACSLVAGPAADKLIKSGWTVPAVRKVMQVGRHSGDGTADRF